MLDGFIMDCATKEGATPEEIDIIRKYNPPTSRQQKCSIACVGESFGFVSAQINFIRLYYRINIKFKLQLFSTDEKWKRFTSKRNEFSHPYIEFTTRKT